MREFAPCGRRFVTFMLSAAVAASLLTACSGATTPKKGLEFTDVASVAARAKQDGADKALSLIADGDATAADLSQSVDDFRACVEAIGMKLSEPVVNPVDGWTPLTDVDFNGVTDSSLQQKAAQCYAKTEQYVELAYELTHKATMDARLMAAVQACLTDRRIDITGSERNVADLVRGSNSSSARGTAVTACIQAKAADLYPGTPITIAF